MKKRNHQSKRSLAAWMAACLAACGIWQGAALAEVPAAGTEMAAEGEPVSFAAGSGPLEKLYQAGEMLLTGTDNVTLRGEARFLLDGEWFKQAEGTYAQEGENSYQAIRLESPRIQGGIRNNGYAVVSRNGNGYVIERYLGKTVVRNLGYNGYKEKILRETVGTKNVLALGESAAALLDGLMTEKVTAAVSGAEMTISAHWTEKDIPPLMNAALNLFWQEAVERYLVSTYSSFSLEGYARIEDFGTVTQGIVYTVSELQLQELELTAGLDPEGRLTRLNGEGRVLLCGRNGETRQLTVSGTLEAGEYGTTRLETAIPEEDRWESVSSLPEPQEEFPYGSVGGLNWADFNLPEIPVPESRLTHRSIGSVEAAEKYAGEVAAMDALGLETPERLQWTVIGPEEGRYHVLGAFPESPDHPEISIEFSDAGQVLRLEKCGTTLEDAVIYESEELDYDYVIQWRTEVGMMLWRFTENMNPGVTEWTIEELLESIRHGIGFTSYDATLGIGEDRYLVLYGMWHRNPAEKVKYVVQTAPEFRVVLVDSNIDPEEGGNG